MLMLPESKKAISDLTAGWIPFFFQESKDCSSEKEKLIMILAEVWLN